MSDLPLTPYGLLTEAQQQRIKDAHPLGIEYYAGNGAWGETTIALGGPCDKDTYRLKPTNDTTTTRRALDAGVIQCGDYIRDDAGFEHLVTSRSKDGTMIKFNGITRTLHQLMSNHYHHMARLGKTFLPCWQKEQS